MLQSNALMWADFVGGKTLDQAPDVAARAIAQWTKEGRAPATINRRLAALKAACRYAWKRGLVEQDVSGRIETLQEPPGRSVYLSAVEVRRLAAAAPTAAYRAAVILLAYTGLRVGELLAVAERPKSDVIVVMDSKTGEGRVVPVAAPARPFLKALPLATPYNTLFDQHRIARRAAGMPHVRLHDLRHTTASLLAATGASLPVIGALLGHKTVATTLRYAHLTDRTLRAAVRKLR